jgi:hypothetical protein
VAIQSILGNVAANQLPRQIKNFALPLFFLITIVLIALTHWRQNTLVKTKRRRTLAKSKPTTEDSVSPDYSHPLNIVIMSALIPYLCVSYWLGFISPNTGALFLLCISPISVSLLVASIMSKNTRNIILSIVAVLITAIGFFGSLWEIF